MRKKPENPKDPEAGWSPVTPYPRVVSYTTFQEVRRDLDTGEETRMPVGDGFKNFRIVRFDSKFHPDRQFTGALADVQTDAAGKPTLKPAKQRTKRGSGRSPGPRSFSGNARRPWAPAEVRREARKAGIAPPRKRRRK